jgi:ribosome-binding protein aMBF1 (putative translation factor)
VALLALIAVVKAVFRTGPRHARATCQLCGGPINRKTYTATVDGKTMILCSNCGRRIADKISKNAVDRLGL